MTPLLPTEKLALDNLFGPFAPDEFDEQGAMIDRIQYLAVSILPVLGTILAVGAVGCVIAWQVGLISMYFHWTLAILAYLCIFSSPADFFLAKATLIRDIIEKAPKIAPILSYFLQAKIITSVEHDRTNDRYILRLVPPIERGCIYYQIGMIEGSLSFSTELSFSISERDGRTVISFDETLMYKNSLSPDGRRFFRGNEQQGVAPYADIELIIDGEQLLFATKPAAVPFGPVCREPITFNRPWAETIIDEDFSHWIDRRERALDSDLWKIDVRPSVIE